MPATSHHMRGARNPIVLSAHSGGPFSRITAAGAPLKNAPRRFFRTGSRPSATTVSSQDTQLRSPTVVAITSATVALKFSSSSVAYSLRIAPAPIWRVVPPATRSLGCSCSGEFQAIARLNLWGPCGRSSGDSVYVMTALQEIRICRRPCRLPIIKLEAQRRCRFTLPDNNSNDVLGAHHAPVYDHKGPVRTYPFRTDNRQRRGSGAAQHRRKRRLCLFTYQAPGGLRDPGWSSPTHNRVHKSIFPSPCQHNL